MTIDDTSDIDALISELEREGWTLPAEIVRNHFMGGASNRKDEVAQALVTPPATSDVEMVRELVKYTDHTQQCELGESFANECTCGYFAVMEKSTAWLAEREK